jgi:hypothetical protein
MMNVERLVEWELARETEVLGENLPQYQFVHPTWPDLGSNPGRCDGKPATNRLSYGTAFLQAADFSSTRSEKLLLVLRFSQRWEEFSLLGYDAVLSGRSLPTFRSKVLAPPSESTSKPNKQSARDKESRLFLVGYVLSLHFYPHFYPEDGGSIFRNICELPDYTASHPSR